MDFIDDLITKFTFGAGTVRPLRKSKQSRLYDIF